MIPTRKQRQAGRILPNRRRPVFGVKGCCICGADAYGMHVENGREFCWTHHPNRAAAALRTGQPWWMMPAPQIAVPNRRTCERILRLAGRTTPPKGKRSKQKRAPRKRARWR